MSAAPDKRIKSLDGLRGLAILMVLLCHLFAYGPLRPLFRAGWMGVDLFFVLSGFLITGILLDTKNKEGWYKDFLLRRVLRIFPLYYAVLIIFAFIAPHFSMTQWFGQYQVYFWTHTSNYLFFQVGFLKPLGHFWSLAIEEQFYLVWPLFVFLFKPKQLAIVSVILLIIGIVIRAFFARPMLTYTIPFAHLDGLVTGALLSIWFRLGAESMRKFHLHVFITTTIIFIVYMIAGMDLGSALLREPFTITVISMFFCGLLIMALYSTVSKKILSHPLLRFFGKYSYAMYIFNSIFFHFANLAGAAELPMLYKLLAYLGVFALTVIVSYLSYHLFEVHFLKMKTKIAESPKFNNPGFKV